MYFKDLYLSSKKKINKQNLKQILQGRQRTDKDTSSGESDSHTEGKDIIRASRVTATPRTHHMHTRTSTFQDGSTKS